MQRGVHMIVYSTEKVSQKIVVDEKTHQKKRLFRVEIEPGWVSTTAIFKSLVEMGPEVYKQAFDSFIENMGALPSSEDVIFCIIVDHYYPSLDKVEESIADKWFDMIKNSIVPSVVSRFTDKNGKIDKKTREGKFIGAHTMRVFDVLASAVYVQKDGGHFYHILDERVEDRKTMTALVERAIFSQKKPAMAYAIDGIRSAFECDARQSKDVAIEPMDLVGIIDWYIKKTEIFTDPNAAVVLAKILYEKSQNDADKAIVIAVFEDNQEEFEKLYKRYPELDFVDRGKYEEFDTVDDFTSAAGIELAEFFAETDESSRQTYSPVKAKSGEKFDRKAYGLMILNEIDKLYEAMKPISSQIKIINIKPNSVKTRKAHVYGKLVAVAAKVDEKWYIILDSVVPGAIYCWHDKKYLEGLETLKSSRAYARSHENIVHKNHRFDKKPLAIYKQILKELGISL